MLSYDDCDVTKKWRNSGGKDTGTRSRSCESEFGLSRRVVEYILIIIIITDLLIQRIRRTRSRSSTHCQLQSSICLNVIPKQSSDMAPEYSSYLAFFSTTQKAQ